MEELSEYMSVAEIPEEVRVFLGGLNEVEVLSAGGVEQFLTEQVRLSKEQERKTKRRVLQFRLVDQRKPYEQALNFVNKHKVL